MKKQIQIPKWLAAVWLFGPYSFAILVIALFSPTVYQDLAIILFLMTEQTFAIYISPKLNSISGGLFCSLSLFSLILLLKGLSCGAIRSMITMELVMNGGFRYIHLLSNEKIRARDFTNKLAFVTIFSDIEGASYVDALTAWKEGYKIIKGVIVAVVIAIGTWFTLAYVDLSTLFGTVEILPRTFFGALLIYSCLTLIDAVYRGSLLCVQPMSILCESAMDAPYFAKSFAEFWGKKWDRPMQTILYHGAYKPCKIYCGLSNAAAVFVTFLVSGGVHTLGVAACGWVSAESCAMMMSFFVVQAFFVLIEGWLQRQNIWLTQGLCWMSSFLFVLPFLELLKL